MSTLPEKVIRVLAPFGSLASLLRNRDKVAADAPGKLTANDLVAVNGRGISLHWRLVAGLPVDHGTVADEAAMLSLHVDSAETPTPRWVVPGDSCIRADDIGWRWHCLSGHGLTLADWERRPLAGALTAIEAGALTAIEALGTPLADPTTTQGDLIVRGATALERLAYGAVGKVLGVTGAGVLGWVDKGGGGGGFALDSDTLIESLIPLAWWRADAGVEEADGDAAEDGDGVSRWLDQSGNGYHLTQANATYRPTFEVGEVNGLPVLRFSAHNLVNLTIPVNLQDHTMVIVGKSNATSGQNYGRISCVGLPSSGYDFNVQNGQTWTFDNTGTPEVRINSGNANYAVQMLATQVGRPARLAAYGYRITARLGTMSADDLIYATSTNNWSTNGIGYNIGCQWRDGAAQQELDNLKADICEIVIFPKGLGNTVFGLLLASLAKKWGL